MHQACKVAVTRCDTRNKKRKRGRRVAQICDRCKYSEIKRTVEDTGYWCQPTPKRDIQASFQLNSAGNLCMCVCVCAFLMRACSRVLLCEESEAVQGPASMIISRPTSVLGDIGTDGVRDWEQYPER